MRRVESICDWLNPSDGWMAYVFRVGPFSNVLIRVLTPTTAADEGIKGSVQPRKNKLLKMRSYSLCVVVAIISVQEIARAQYTVRSPNSILDFGIWGSRSSIPSRVTPGASIDVRELFRLFRLGRKPAKPIALLSRCLCPGRLQCYRKYVFPIISLSSRQLACSRPQSRLGRAV